MSEDEIMVMLGCAGLALVRWPYWFFRTFVVSRRLSKHVTRLPVYLAPFVTAGILWVVLTRYASFDVRHDPVYLTFYMVMGAAWGAAMTLATSLLGVDYRDDVAERGNGGAAWVVGGSVLGGTLPFIGSNIGDGPGWWVVLYTGGAAMLLFFGLWLLFEKTTHASESITVDRDASAGLRLAGLLVGNGLILARASAGNWYGSAQAVQQVFQVGLAAVALTVVAIVVERMLRPTPSHPTQPVVAGVFPAAFYLGSSAGWVAIAGMWT